MKRFYLYTILALSCLMCGCTDDFEEKNTDPDAFTTLSASDLAGLFLGAECYGVTTGGNYQTNVGLHANFYAQYFAHGAQSYETDRYGFRTAWAERWYSFTYVNVGAQLQNIFDNAEETSGEYALANIMWVYAFHRLTDYFGPIPYIGCCQGEAVPYNSVKEIYYDFFDRLTSAVTVLKSLSSGTTVMADGDLIYSGDISKWIKFANTLRLRLALRISNVDPSKAQTEAEAAYSSGLMTSNDDNAFFACNTNNSNFQNQLSTTGARWSFGMSSTIYSYLVGWDDPRLEYYFQPSPQTSIYHGIRNGMPTTVITDANATTSLYTGRLSERWVTYSGTTGTADYTTPHEAMYYCEALFLRAEGALNGWSMGGTAQDLYEEGIRASMEQWGVTDDDLIEDYIVSTATPCEPEDYYDSPAVCDLQIAWGSTEAVQRQQIGTQKWLATYPNGCEGWAEFRRTGYPSMYPVIYSENSELKGENNDDDDAPFIQRLMYPDEEYSTDATNVATGVELLGGEDSAATPLWWSLAAN